MDYRQKNAVEKLQNILKPYRYESYHNKNEKTQNSKLLWNAPRFFSQIVTQSNPQNNLWTVEEFEYFTTNYKTVNHLDVDLNKLYEKHWLRNVLGFVEIPTAVRSVISDYEKYRNHKYELLFLKTLIQQYPKKSVEVNLYSKALLNFEHEHKVKLNTDWYTSTKRVTEKDGYLKIGHVDYYCLLLDNWDDFSFLYALKQHKQAISDQHLNY